MRLRNLVLLWALATPAVSWSQTIQTVASGGNLHYVGAGITTWGNGDIGAQINAAYAALPARGGTIVVIAPANGACYSFMTPIVAAVPGKYLLFQGGALASQVTRPSVAVCLNFIQTNSSAAITLDYVPPGETANIATHGIQDLTLVNNQCETIGGCGSNATGISFGGGNGGAAGATFAELKIVGFGTGFGVTGSNSRIGNLTFRDCNVSYNTTGFLDTDSDGGHISFDACHFHGNATAVSSTASLRISNSWMESNTVLGVNCSSPAACDINSDHFESAEADSTHFLAGNGVFSVLGGDMRDDRGNGNTDWWMNFAGASFFILGTALTTGGRTATHVVLNKANGIAVVQNNSSSILTVLYSNPSAILAIEHPSAFDRQAQAKSPNVFEPQRAATPQLRTAIPPLAIGGSDSLADSAHAQAVAYDASVIANGANKILYVDGLKYPTIDSAILACGEASRCLINVPPNYSGKFPPLEPLTPNIIIHDYHAPGPAQPPLGTNADTWNGQTQGVASFLRHSWRVNDPLSKSYELTTNLASYSGTLPGNGNSIEGITSVALIVGRPTFPGSALNLVGLESHAFTQSSGGTLRNAFGVVTSVGQQAGTTNITTAAGLLVQTNMNVGGKITNSYGIFMQGQNAGTARNFSFYSQGAGLFANDSIGSGINFEDSRSLAHPVLTALSSNNELRFRPLLDSAGFCFDNTSSTSSWLCLNSSGVSIPNSSLSIGGGAALATTSQSGTGLLCMTTRCALKTPTLTNPVIDGISVGTGIQGSDFKLLTSGLVSGTGNLLCLDANGGATTARCGASILKVTKAGPSCTTDRSSYSSCTNTLTWPTPFVDANYSVICTGIGPSDPHANITVARRSASNVVVNVVTYGSVEVSFTELDCTGIHP